jgi:hypothetical protein
MRIRRWLSVLALIASLGLLWGCSSGPSGPTITPPLAVLSAGQTAQFTASQGGTSIGGATWLVNGIVGGNSALGTISSDGLYTAPSKLPAQAVFVNVREGAKGQGPGPALVRFFDPGKFETGTVASTENPLVAAYSFLAPKGASVQVEFGQSTRYGLKTWARPAPPAGGDVHILVAGMLANSTYHMRAIVHLASGTQVMDSDHSFTTGAIPASLLPQITAKQTSGFTPAPGIELLCLAPPAKGDKLTALATDLSGHVLWYYHIGKDEWPFPMKLLPNGRMLLVASPNVNSQGQILPGTGYLSGVREINLAGDVLYQITLKELNDGLAKFGASFRAESFHHDVLQLPNGHLILLVNYTKTINNVAGVPQGTQMLGDALVDWKPGQGPVWTWSTFDHLSVARAPYGRYDWTHANALLYSPDDGDLLLSLRDQNWIIKINYDDGAGNGNILWRLGPEGNFTLPSGDAPIDWNYGQHGMNFAGPGTSGIFDLTFFNNGNNRLVNAKNTVCGSSGAVPCYSSVPIYQVNEYTKKVQILWQDNLSSVYSICCGNSELLSNGDVEFDVANNIHTPGLSFVEEVTQETPPQMVWQMNIQGQLAYRAFRIPSLYPGVQWTQAQIAESESPATGAQAQETARGSQP